MSESSRPKLEFLKIREEHVPLLMEIEEEAYPEPWTEGMFRQEVESPVSQFFVTFLGGRIVGYIGYWEGVEEAHITSVTVRKEFRGRGYGRDELAFALDHAAKRGLLEAALEVRASNIPAQNLYKSMGFRQIGVRRKYYAGTGEDAWVMVLSLTNESAAK
jgi:ribosomal-protein-alanine N-acetyltransferase